MTDPRTNTGKLLVARHDWARNEVLAIEAEAAAPLDERYRALLSDIYDCFMPMHSGPCANQEDEADCICPTGPVLERLREALEDSDGGT